MIKIRRIDLPDEVVIEHEGARFIFDRPSYTDFLDYDLSSRAGISSYLFGRNGQPGKLKRLEGVEFEDGTEAGIGAYKDFPLEVIAAVMTRYLDERAKYFDTEKKRAPTEKEPPGSSEKDS